MLRSPPSSALRHQPGLSLSALILNFRDREIFPALLSIGLSYIDIIRTDITGVTATESDGRSSHVWFVSRFTAPPSSSIEFENKYVLCLSENSLVAIPPSKRDSPATLSDSPLNSLKSPSVFFSHVCTSYVQEPYSHTRIVENDFRRLQLKLASKLDEFH